jgi:hypothetical protein
MVSGTREHAGALRAEAAAALAPLGLRLAEEKTRVVHVDEGFDFLGFTIRRMRKRGTSRHYVYTTPSRKSLQAIRDKVSEMTYRSTRNQDLGALLQRVNQALAGWASYFRHGVSKATFNAVDHHAWNRIMRWLRGSTTDAPGCQCRRCAGASASLAPGYSQPTGHGSPAPQQSASPATTTGERRYPARGHPDRPHNQRPRHAESPVRGDTHAGFGGRAGETHQGQPRQGAPVRPNRRLRAR